MKSKKQIFLILMSLTIIGIILYYIIPWLRNISVTDILDLLPDDLYLSALVLMGLYALKSVSVFFPIVVLNIAVGSIYPLQTAFIINSIGSLVAVTVPYIIGTLCNEKWMVKLQNKYKNIDKLEQYRCNNQIVFTYLTRAVGFLPCDILSCYMGNRHMNYFLYALGSLMGMFPAMILNTIFGAELSKGFTWRVGIFGVMLFIISFLLSYMANKFLQKKAK